MFKHSLCFSLCFLYYHYKKRGCVKAPPFNKITLTTVTCDEGDLLFMGILTYPPYKESV